jgi:asparagine N-glycosylation enzyme membrane subunit Stt3
MQGLLVKGGQNIDVEEYKEDITENFFADTTVNSTSATLIDTNNTNMEHSNGSGEELNQNNIN